MAVSTTTYSSVFRFVGVRHFGGCVNHNIFVRLDLWKSVISVAVSTTTFSSDIRFVEVRHVGGSVYHNNPVSLIQLFSVVIELSVGE